jgi:hypothetical protein
VSSYIYMCVACALRMHVCSVASLSLLPVVTRQRIVSARERRLDIAHAGRGPGFSPGRDWIRMSGYSNYPNLYSIKTSV